MSATIPEEIGALLAQAGVPLCLDSGEILFALGDDDSVMYWIESGSVDLFFAPGKQPKRMQVGDFFGELAFILGNHQRTATAVVSSEQTRLRRLDQPALSRLVEESPQSIFALVRKTVCRLVQSEQQLTEELQQRNRELEFTLDFSGSLQESLSCFRAGGLLDRQTGLFTRQTILAYLEGLDNHDNLRQAGCWLIRVELDNLEGLRRVLGCSFIGALADWAARLLRQVAREGDMPFQIDRAVFGILLPHANETLVADMTETFSSLLKSQPLKIPGHDLHLGAGVDSFPLERFPEVTRWIARYGTP